MQIRQSPLKGLWLPLSFLLLMWFSVIIPSASPHYFVCQLHSQLGTLLKYLSGTAVPLCQDGRRWHCCWERCTAMAPGSPVGFCTMSMQDGAGRGVLLFCKMQTTLCSHTWRSRVAAAGVPHPSENMYFSKISVLPRKICVILTYHLPSAKQMSNVSLSLPANGNAVSDDFVFCVNQQLGAALLNSLKPRVAAVTQGSTRLQSTCSCGKSWASPQPGD